MSSALTFAALLEVATHVEHNSGAEEHGNAESEEAALVAAGEVSYDSHPIGTDEAADDAEGIDGGDTGGSAPSLEQAGWKRPERALHGVIGDVKKDQRRQDQKHRGGEPTHRKRD